LKASSGSPDSSDHHGIKKIGHTSQFLEIWALNMAKMGYFSHFRPCWGPGITVRARLWEVETYGPW